MTGNVALPVPQLEPVYPSAHSQM